MSGWPWNKPTPPIPPVPTTRILQVIVRDTHNQDMDGVMVSLMVSRTANDVPIWDEEFTVHGLATLTISRSLVDTQLMVTVDGYVDVDQHINVAGIAQVWVGGGTPGPGMLCLPPMQVVYVPPPWTPTREQKKLVMCNFCNLRDSTGRPIFSSSLAAQSPAMQDAWIARELAAGGTHYVFSIGAGYTNYPPVVNFFLEGRMVEWLRTLDRVLAASLTPVVFLHSGDYDPGVNYLRCVLAQIPAAYYDHVVWVAGWETVRGGWTSRQFRDNNDVVRSIIGPDAILAAHLSTGRLSFSSHAPVESDDPWDGNEMACWRTGWGADRCQPSPFDVLLYQTEPYRQGDEFTTDTGKGERAEEVATRVLGTYVKGAPDWFVGLPRPTLIAYETVAYHFIRGQADEAYARDVASFFKTLGFQGFGNGLPRSKATPPLPVYRKRYGLVQTERMRWHDDTGWFSPLGATLFWALRGWKFERDRLKRNLEFLAKHQWDYVRILGEVGWSGNEIDPRWPDYDECLARFLDCAYDEFALRTELTVTGGASFGTSYAKLAERTAAVVSGRMHTILNLEAFNENTCDIASGMEITRVLRTLLPHHHIATSCYGEQGEVGSADYYISQGANGATFHPDRNRSKADGMWRHARQTWDWKSRTTWVSVNEPGGPLSSVVPYNEVHHNVYARAVAMLCGCAWVFHNAAGVYGQPNVNAAGGARPANLWETPHIDTTMNALRGLDQYIPEDVANGRYSHMSLQPHPLTSDHCWPEDRADHGTVRDYASNIGNTWTQVLLGIKNYAQLTATMGACELRIIDPVDGYTATKRLAAGESFRLDLHTKDSDGYGGYLVRGTVV